MHISQRSPWIAFVPLSIAIGTTFAFGGALNVALPTIGATTPGSASTLAWVVVGYALAVTAPIPVLGRVADLHGRRGPYLIGLGLFAVATLGCALAPSIGWLAIARVAQGLGAAAVVSNTTVLLVDIFEPQLLTAALGANAAAAAVGQVAGPLAGGVIVDAWGWRALFVVGAVLIGLAWAVAVVALPRHRQVAESTGGRSRLEPHTAVSSITVLAALVVGLSGLAGSVPWQVSAAVGPVAVLALMWFVHSSVNRADPLIPMRVWRDRSTLGWLGLAGAGYLIAFAQPLAVSLWLQQHLQISASATAVWLVGAPIATLVAALAAPRLGAITSPERLVRAGFGLFSLGSAVVVVAVLTGSAPLAAVGLTVVGAGNGVFLTPNTALIVNGADPGDRGVVNALRSTAQNAGTLLGSLVVFSAGHLAAGSGAPYAGPAVAGVGMTTCAILGLWLSDRRCRRRRVDCAGSTADPAARVSQCADQSARSSTPPSRSSGALSAT